MKDPLFRDMLKFAAAVGVAVVLLVWLVAGDLKPIGRVAAHLIETAEGDQGRRIAGRGR